MKHSLKEIVSPPNLAKFYFIRDDQAFYTIELNDKTLYQFPINFDEMKSATFNYEMKAITLMGWVRKAIDNNIIAVIKKRD
ncbi:MAG: hypothetical protein JETCAE03_35850 [Ignavibacteriaceae bacterium]|jgi:hypothetical protein|nr:MAG: hypothetical protein JETCAE03_35850 [Ignavibacteriaceae bacterium]